MRTRKPATWRKRLHSANWGGARPGTGKKPKGTALVTVPAQPIARPTAREQELASIAMASVIAKSRELAAEKRKRKPEDSPFKLPTFPKSVLPPKEMRMAMDEEAIDWAGSAWMAQSPYGLAQEGLVFLGYPYLAELSQRPEFRTFSEINATEMTRKWIDYTAITDAGEDGKGETTADSELEGRIKELRDFMDHLKARDRFADLALQDGLFGRTHLNFDFGDMRDAELMTPIGNGRDRWTEAKVGKGALKALKVIEPVWTYPTTYNATYPLAPDWYDPQVWYVLGQQIHKSRLLPFIGRPVPDLLKPSYSFGGLSLSQIAKPYVDIWLTTRQSVADLIHSFSIMILSTDMATLMQPGDANNLLFRLQMFNELRDNQGVFAINEATEDFKNVSASLAGLHELQAQAQEHMMSVARIPAVKYTGMQPDGLNASSEGEIRTFYDSISATQNRFFRPGLTTTIDLAQITLWGERDPRIAWDFVPLWELTEKEKSEKRKADAETGKILIDSSVISPEEERKRIAADPESGYHGIDPEDVPNIMEEEAEGSVDPNSVGKKSGAGGGEGGGGATDEAPFEEGKHPRDEDGQFASGGGSSGGGSEEEKSSALNLFGNLLGKYGNEGGAKHGDLPALLTSSETKDAIAAFGSLGAAMEAFKSHAGGGRAFDPSKFKTKADLVGGLLTKAGGTTTGEILKHTGWPSVSVPKQAKIAGLKLEKFKEGGVTKYKGTPMTDAEKAESAKADAAAIAPAVKVAQAANVAPPTKAEVTKSVSEQALKENPAMAAVVAKGKPAPQATPAEIEKAKKAVGLQLNYVPGADAVQSAPGKTEALKLVAEFNVKYATKQLTTIPELNQKVQDFKDLAAKVGIIAQVEKTKAAEWALKQKAEADAIAAAEKAKEVAAAKANAEKNKEVMTALGINAQEAEGFDALVKMQGGQQKGVVEAFKSYEEKAAKFGYPISGFECALIMNYSNGGYTSVNKALRAGSLTGAQHVYTKMVNKALQKMPRYTGDLRRGTTLSSEQQALYIAGNVVEERALTSASVSSPFGGNTSFKIKAIGKRGAHIKKLSHYPGEDEVLFSARTFFKVTKVEGKPGGAMTVHMEEMDD